MSRDVGRNDPCPCGSGRKYKQCCLRKRKQGGATAKKTAQPTWRERFEKAVQDGRGMRRRDAEGAMQRWREGWRELQENLPDEVDTFEGAQEAYGGKSPSIQNWMWDVLNTGRGLVTQSPDRVALAVDFAEEFLARFGGESGELRRSIQAELAYFVGRAGDIEAAEEICRRLIGDHPEEAGGYCTLADVYLGAEPPKLSRALDILNEAVEHPVKDPEGWSLTRRVEQVRRDLRMRKARESEHFVEWETFWNDFEEADLDEKIQMARERIDHAPDFDEEWVFSLMIEGLMEPCREQRRDGDWIDVLEYLREKRPEYVQPEAGVLGAHAVEFTLAADGEYLDQALGLLFSDPSHAVDHIFRTLELLAFFDISRIRHDLLEHWPEFRRSKGLMASASVQWANWAMLAQIAAWAEDDLGKSRSLSDFDEALGDMMDELTPERVETFGTLFLGRQLDDFDAEAASKLDDDIEHYVALGFAFARSLVEDEGWSAFKALLAGTYVIGFLRHLPECDDPFVDEYTTHRATQSKGLRRELKELRGPWREDYQHAPHPDLAVGFADALRNDGPFGSPYTAAAFFEAVVRLAPWLAERGFITNPKLTQMIQKHFKRRIAEVSQDFVSLAGNHPKLAQSLEQTERWLNSSSWSD